MSEETTQPPDQPTRKRSAQGSRRTGSKRTQQATRASVPAQEATAPLAAPDTTDSTAPQVLLATAAPAGPAPDEPPLGERWGEFPTKERQEALEKQLQVWSKAGEYKGRAGPFVGFILTGADVFWLAVIEAGEGDATAGRKILTSSAVVDLPNLHLEGANLSGAHLQRAALVGAHLAGTRLVMAQLNDAALVGADLEGADLWGAQLIGAALTYCDLRAVDIRRARMDLHTRLISPRLDTRLLAADVLWSDVPLIHVDWEQVPCLGDEEQAHQSEVKDQITSERRPKTFDEWLQGYRAAARAYRQLAVALRSQGITETADRFTYRALIMQRKALWWQLRNRKLNKLGAYLFSLFLAVLTGYGFRLWRMIVAYVLLILAFAGAYWGLDVHRRPQPFSFWQAIILSVTAFHGRVFSNPFNLSDPQIVVTALEAICGLVIEGVFIAMLTQRFFNR